MVLWVKINELYFQVTGYGENGTGDANDMWRLEKVGGREGEVVNTVTTKLKFHHSFVKCVLTCSTKPLPKWGFEQGELSCNPTVRDPHTLWNYITLSLARLAPSSLASPLVHTCLAATLATCCYTFYMFSDLFILMNK